MKIESSNIQLASARSSVQADQKSEELQAWIGPRPSSSGGPGSSNGQGSLLDRVTLSPPPAPAPKPKETEASGPDASQESEDSRDQELLGTNLYILKKFVEMLTGRKIKVFDASEMQNGSGSQDSSNDQSAQPSGDQGWGVSYESHESHYEQETTAVAAQGIIKTSDGKEINFSLQLLMDREFYQESSESFKAGDAAKKTDPLVINFDGTAAELTDTKFSFDLDSDGSGENISFLRPGSGFLVFDKNHDGTINNGSELFGPSTGNGLSELAAYDQDQNHWIDENDSIYNNLAVWTKDGAGKDRLTSLKDAGVGAIYLSQIDSQFELTNGADQSNGQVSKTGIYAGEDGSVKTIQQVDLVV